MSIFLHLVFFLLAGLTGLGHPASTQPAHVVTAMQSNGHQTPLDILEPHP